MTESKEQMSTEMRTPSRAFTTGSLVVARLANHCIWLWRLWWNFWIFFLLVLHPQLLSQELAAHCSLARPALLRGPAWMKGIPRDHD